jgi:hypothetical protein
MNALFGLLIVAGIIYGIFIDATFWKFYALLVTLYTIFVLYQCDSRENPKRKTILISTWGCKYKDNLSYQPVNR